MIELVKKNRRQKKDDRKKEAAAVREQLEHEANKFIALRNQEKRLQQKQDQEDRLKKRLEEKALRTKLQEKQVCVVTLTLLPAIQISTYYMSLLICITL